jgi:hypothetical protein
VSSLEILNNTSLLDQNSKIISISVLNSLLYVDTIQTIHQVGFDSFGIKFILSVLLGYQFGSNYPNPRDYWLEIKANDFDMYELFMIQEKMEQY